jgi:hypothetical protein
MPVVGDFFDINQPTAGQTFTRSGGSAAHAMVSVAGDCYSNSVVSVTMIGPNNNSTQTATTQTRTATPTRQGSAGYIWSAGEFGLYSPGTYTVEAKNTMSQSNGFTVV